MTLKHSSLKKSILSVSLALAVSISGSTVFAAESSLSKYDSYMMKAGYPEELIQVLNEEQKAEIFELKAVYAGHKKVTGKLIEANVPNNSKKPAQTSPEPQSLSNFNQYITSSRVSVGGTGFAEFILSYNWNWAYDPIFTAEDKFGLAWTDDFDAISSSARYGYSSEGWQERPITYPNCQGRLTSGGSTQYGYDAYSPGMGIGWAVNLISGFSAPGCGNYTTDKHSGWGQVQIRKAHNNSGNADSTSAKATYFHRELSSEGELQFSKTGPAVTITNKWSYDASPDAGHNWTWYHVNF
ncbi:hypothetical protein AV654_00510 [Paenibacillus elgii]|uniref:Uncharacterized protein n=1 Tax=Paenibacillus elgii TaxID=189691 RepID=A0A164ARG1_9BACL|nr:hypothetical protein [Paenibacillus elgii]KZE84422.1 hypothetical protein AV654_00510 [Paenibacillus elgii]